MDGASRYFFRSTSLNTLFISQVFTEVPGHRDAQVRSVCWFRGPPTPPTNHSYHHFHADTQNSCPSCRRMRTFIMVLFSTSFWPEISTQRCIRKPRIAQRGPNRSPLDPLLVGYNRVGLLCKINWTPHQPVFIRNQRRPHFSARTRILSPGT